MAAKSSPQQILKRLTSAESLPQFLLITSPDRIRLQRALRKLLAGARKGSGSAQVLDARSFQRDGIGELRGRLQSLSLFQSDSRYVLTNLESLSAALTKSVAGILQEVAAGVEVIGTSEPLPAANPLVKLASRHDALVKFEALDQTDLERWTRKELSETGLSTASPGALRLLIEIGDEDLDRIAGLADHLAQYTGASGGNPFPGTIEEKDLLNVFVHHPDSNEFELVDLLGRGRRAEAAVLLKRLLESGKSEFLLLSLVSRAVSQYLVILQSRAAGEPEGRIQAALKLPPGIYRKVAECAGRYSVEQLTSVKREILRTDSLLKNRSLGGEALLQRLCDTLAV